MWKKGKKAILLQCLQVTNKKKAHGSRGHRTSSANSLDSYDSHSSNGTPLSLDPLIALASIVLCMRGIE